MNSFSLTISTEVGVPTDRLKGQACQSGSCQKLRIGIAHQSYASFMFPVCRLPLSALS
jgi:hypothetical protein